MGRPGRAQPCTALWRPAQRARPCLVGQRGSAGAGGDGWVTAAATLAAFLLSGALHELMNRLALGPAVRTGPQLVFFACHGLAIVAERGMQVGGGGVRGLRGSAQLPRPCQPL